MSSLSKKYKNAFLSFCLPAYWLLAALCNDVRAQESIVTQEPKPTAKENSQPVFNWLIEKRDDWSHGFGNMVSSIDGFFAGKDTEAQTNDSYLRLRFGVRWIEGDGLSDDSDLKLRIDLPTTKNRWKLFIENQLDELETLRSSNREDVIDPETEDDGFYGGISRERTTENWQFRPELGVKLSAPLDPFMRFRAKRPFELPGLWSGRFQQSIYYFHQDGFGTKGELLFERPWGEQDFWQIKSEGKWEDETNNMGLAQVFTLQQSLTENAAVNYELGILGNTKPSTQTSSYYINMRYRQRLYEDWLFFDVVPGVTWPRTTDFEPVYSITSRIEILFSD